MRFWQSAMICIIAGVLLPSQGHPASGSLPKPYLMLVTFGAPRLKGWSEAEIAMINASPFDGVASIVVGAYDDDPVPAEAEFEQAIATLRAGLRKHVWPWCFSNRLIGRKGEARHHSSAPKEGGTYFGRIVGMDIDNQAGALGDFLDIWRLSLRLAKKLQAPGVVLDLEAYNDYSTYDIRYLASTRGETLERVRERLIAIGAQMADIVAQEYPTAIIWSLFTRLDAPLSTPGAMCEGILQQAKQKSIPLRLIDGGETNVGYYNPSVEVLRHRLEMAEQHLAPYLREYPRQFFLGGTIAPYHEPDRITDWIKRASETGGRFYRNADEFEPNMDALFAARQFIWIYGASAAHYVPFNPADTASTEAVHNMLKRSLRRWRAAYQMLPLPQPAAPAARTFALERRYAAKQLDLREWQKGDPKTDRLQPEVSLRYETRDVKVGPTSLVFTVHVDWENPKESPYPIGWPMISHYWQPPLDLSDYDVCEFWVKVESEAPLPNPCLKFGLSQDNAEPLYQEIAPPPKGKWERIVLPLETIGKRDKITRLTFYLSEAWYQHGDIVSFHLDGIRFLRQLTPEIVSARVVPLAWDGHGDAPRLAVKLGGEVVKQGFRIRCRASREKGKSPLCETLLPVEGKSLLVTFPPQRLESGVHRVIVELLSASGQCVDKLETKFAVVRTDEHEH